MKYKLSLILTAVALTLSLTGCGTSKNIPMDFSSEGTASSSSQTTNPTQIPEENPEKADDLFEQSQSSGSVRDPFSGGCKLIPTVYEDGEAYEPVPGYENEQELVTIQYSETCSVQYAYADMQTGEISFQDATSENIKKQSYIIVYGEYDSNHVLQAEKIFIYRIED